MACPQCDTTAPAGASWCGDCGARLRREEEPDQPADPTEAQADRTAATSHERGLRARPIVVGLVVAVLGGLVIQQVTSDAPDAPAGFTSRGDGSRSGVVSVDGIPAPTEVAWRQPVPSPSLLTTGTDVLGTTTVDGRELLVVHDPAMSGQRLTSHDAVDGSVVATSQLPLGQPPFDTSLAAGFVAHRTQDDVSLVEVATGERRWTLERGLRDDTAVTPFGVVGVPSEAPLSLVLLSLEDGEELWRYDRAVQGRVTRVLATDDAIVVAGLNPAPFLVGLDPETGGQQWALRQDQLPRRDGVPLAPLVTDGASILVDGAEGALLVDARDGSATRLRLPDGFVAASGAFTDGLLAVTDGATRILGVRLGDRPDVVWSTPAVDAPILALAATDDAVAVRGDAGTTLLDPDTGATNAQVGPGAASSRLTMTRDSRVPRVASDGTLELVGRDGTAWRVPTIATHLPDVVTDDGTVAVTTAAGLQVHDIADGARRFAYEAFDPQLVTAAQLSAPALRDGRVAITNPPGQPTQAGGLRSLVAESGIVTWATDDSDATRGTPVVVRDQLVLPVGATLVGFDADDGDRSLVVDTGSTRTDVAASDGWLVATSPPSGDGEVWVGRRADDARGWTIPLRTCAPPMIHDGLVVVASDLGLVSARALADGELRWTLDLGGSVCRPLAIAGATIVALVDDRALVGIDAVGGEQQWRVELSAAAAGAPVVAGDEVLVPTLSGEVVAHDSRSPTDGPSWRVDVQAVPAGAVAVDGDTVLVVTRDGELVALR